MRLVVGAGRGQVSGKRGRVRSFVNSKIIPK